MSIPESMHALLTAALPGVPVLLPEEASLPGNYAPLGPDGLPQASGDRGLTAYLAAHPEGFVQIGQEQGLSVAFDGAAGSWLVTVDCVAPDAAARDALLQGALTIATRGGVRQTPFHLLTPPTTRKDPAGFHTAQFILTPRKGL